MASGKKQRNPSPHPAQSLPDIFATFEPVSISSFIEVQGQGASGVQNGQQKFKSNDRLQAACPNGAWSLSDHRTTITSPPVNPVTEIWEFQKSHQPESSRIN